MKTLEAEKENQHYFCIVSEYASTSLEDLIKSRNTKAKSKSDFSEIEVLYIMLNIL